MSQAVHMVTANSTRPPKQPQDHKKPAAQIEAERQGTVTVEYAGNTYEFPGSLDAASGDVIDAIDDQKLSYALRNLLDTEQWQRFKATKPLVRDYAALFDAYALRIGLGSAGE